MEQLIFLAVIIIFSILESISRGRRQRQRGQQLPGPEWEWEPETPSTPEQATSRGGVATAGRTATVERGEELATYDQDRSYDERAVAEREEYDELAEYERIRARRMRQEAEPKARAEAEARSSEGMIPAELWEELAGLARSGQTGEQPVRRPAPQPAPARSGRPRERLRRPERATRLELERAAPSTLRVPAEPMAAPAQVTRPIELATGRAAKGTAWLPELRRELRSGPAALRRAVVLREVLGPPVAFAPERPDALD